MLLSKNDLRIVYQNLARLRPPRGVDPSVEELVQINGVLDKVAKMIEEARAEVERGARILAWRLHPSISPTMNELAQWKARTPWRALKAREQMEAQLAAFCEATPGLDLCGAQKARWVRVTRFTPQVKNVDDAATDVIGGKMPVDMLRRAGLIVNDSPRWLTREAHVLKTKMGNTHVLVELFEVAEHAVPIGPPEDGPAPPEPVKRGVRVKAVAGDEDVQITKRGRKATAKARASAAATVERPAGLNLALPPGDK